eukprot:TRINITY_DN18312_c0_g1_i1.p1 TRINITY_DN18312_c0_g1~~TRINITY_DN18312_c0_g1_i1.p1  ORF type:complete len:224 (-),score=34.74 TRINITY_DN18312_c0_g1_i1:187-804(-)
MRFGQAVRVLSLSAFIGTIILVIVDGMPWMDALYFMVTALSTVGVGDVAPKTVVGRLVSTLLTFITISSWLAMPRMIAEQGSLAKQRLVTFLIFSLLWFAHRCNLERLSVSDAVWLAVALATGQGFGDVHLETRAGRASVALVTIPLHLVFAWAVAESAALVESLDAALLRQLPRLSSPQAVLPRSWRRLRLGRKPSKTDELHEV